MYGLFGLQTDADEGDEESAMDSGAGGDSSSSSSSGDEDEGGEGCSSPAQQSEKEASPQASLLALPAPEGPSPAFPGDMPVGASGDPDDMFIGMGLDNGDEIFRRTRAQYNLSDVTIDELEALLNSVDEEIIIDDNDEYQDFLAVGTIFLKYFKVLVARPANKI